MHTRFLSLFGLFLFFHFVSFSASAQEKKGCIAGDCQNGKGTFVFEDGNKFEGTFLNNQPQNGTLHLTNGEKYIGGLVDGQPNGIGLYTWPSGQKYEGHFSYGKRTGPGKYNFPNGDTYEGNFLNGSVQGNWIYVWQNR